MSNILLRMKLKTKAALIVGAILIITLFSTTSIQLREVSTQLQEALQVKTLVLGEELVQEITKVLDFGLSKLNVDFMPLILLTAFNPHPRLPSGTKF